tara:strand:- start:6 stop:359 length:354 start_codon:yes stop_codon:yes gene_type:complete
MIIYGKKGSLILFYNNLLIGSYPLSNLKNYERYKFQGEYLILKSLKTNIPLKLQIHTYINFCNEIYKRKQNKLGIYRADYEMFLSCIFALIKLKQLDEEDSTFMVEKKKNKTKKSFL